ncbi:DUF2264 domain-containing protein [Edaphobacter albus]|uniref:DUF2264 domain-containing protein n=1 Tax=Edaphobacter sp. 4G125 TaxID=2763071 RepID=UPI001644F01A|nr:DUF2264 domain-containing protein [Edaphobacter sp. 4G125]QNI37584.1 DUF2264 domain-containing protein [Edaphobacter sp. 4G125]
MSNQDNLSSRREFLQSTVALGLASTLPSHTTEAQTSASPTADRTYWIEIVRRVSHPVLSAVSKAQLRAIMPVEAKPGLEEERRKSTHLEAFGRLLSGIAPWLETTVISPEEAALQTQYREWARAGIHHGTDPSSPDYMNFGMTSQSVVDTAFLVLGILRAPKQLWEPLDRTTRANLVKALQATRQVLPGQSNWLLFSAMVEAGLCFMGEEWDSLRVDYAIQMHKEWFLGDGTYGDGAHFHWDYYNSFVIQPMLLQVLDTLPARSAMWRDLKPVALERARRYAAIQERLISPEATFPVIGRSITYRFGAFHLLADIALRRQLPELVSPEQVRCALTAVMRRMIERPGTFDAKGWLTIGFAGHQPGLGEPYISTGSLYLCAVAWLPLGLPANDSFWSGPAKPWTEAKIWNGQDAPADHASSA